ncbi:MAG: SpvB/TcaC N-terminal domain-containing protein, partial [Nitrospirota bacterium]
MKTNNKISQILCLIFLIFIFSFSAVNVHATEVVEAVENVADNTETAPTANVSGNTDSVSGDSAESEVDSADITESGGASAMSSEEPVESFQSESLIKPLEISPSGNSGAAITNIPIIVPAGRKGIQPSLSLNYNSGRGNGWIGVGWSLDIGAIERNRKYDVDYSANDFIVTGNGASELVQRSDWPGYYGAKIEGDFSKYQYITAEDRWEEFKKDGTKLFYGQDPYTGHE